MTTFSARKIEFDNEIGCFGYEEWIVSLRETALRVLRRREEGAVGGTAGGAAAGNAFFFAEGVVY